jgi:hypothetical protein
MSKPRVLVIVPGMLAALGLVLTVWILALVATDPTSKLVQALRAGLGLTLLH